MDVVGALRIIDQNMRELAGRLVRIEQAHNALVKQMESELNQVKSGVLQVAKRLGQLETSGPAVEAGGPVVEAGGPVVESAASVAPLDRTFYGDPDAAWYSGEEEAA